VLELVKLVNQAAVLPELVLFASLFVSKKA
jgi:hypothetical protein